MTTEQQVVFDVFCDYLIELIEKYGVKPDDEGKNAEKPKDEGTD